MLYKTASKSDSESAGMEKEPPTQTSTASSGGVDRFNARFSPTSGSVVSLADIGVDGVPKRMLADMYQGLALNLAHELSRARIEAIRLSGLKAFNDRQSVMYLEDEIEKLRADVIEKFELPVNEKILQTAKAYVVMPTELANDTVEGPSEHGVLRATSRQSNGKRSRSFDRDCSELSRRRVSLQAKNSDIDAREWKSLSRDAAEQDARAASVRRAGKGSRKFRFIVMTNHLFFDPEIFGPSASVHSEIVRAQQLHKAYPKAGSHKTLIIEVQGDRLYGLELLTNMRCYEISFNSVDTFQQVLHRLEEMCVKAEERRQQQRRRYFESAHMQVLLEKCSRVHQLRKGMSLTEAASTDSLFVVRTGQIKLKRDGTVFRQIFEGECFGATEFVERTVSGRFTAVAAGKTVVLELRPCAVDAVINDDIEHASLFYSTLCKVMDVDYREAMEEMFPGTWSRKTITPQQDELKPISQVQVQRVKEKRALRRAMSMMSEI